MAKNLVVVESPAKAKTINKYLGKDFVVKASIGHIKDLPSKGLGVDIQNNFEPEYEIIPDSKKRNNNLLVVTLLRIRNDLVFRLKVVLNVDTKALRWQIFDMPDRGLHDEVLAEILIDRLRLGRRFDNYEILSHYTFDFRSATDEASVTEGCFRPKCLCFLSGL